MYQFLKDLLKELPAHKNILETISEAFNRIL